MLDVLERAKKRAEPEADAKSDRAAGFLSSLRGSDPDATLNQLSGWLAPKTRPAHADPMAQSEILARIEDAGAAHVVTLLAQYLGSPEGKQAARESTWKSLLRYQSSLTQGLCASAEALASAAITERGLRPQAAVSAARALGACRRLAKICLIHYASVPGSLWRLAYSVHAHAEKAGCALFPAKAHTDLGTIVTAEQELLRLLMLQVSAPDMMAPEHIEVADRVLDQVGEHFTLRAPGVADNPFCFEPGGDAPPRRASEPAAAAVATRYFGPGTGFDALARIHKELTATRNDAIRAFGPDIPLGAKLTAVQHLLAFWRAKSPYTPPPHAQASGNLQVLHRYAQIWNQISSSRSGKLELALVDSHDNAASVAEEWVLRDAGGNELGAEIPQSGSDWAKCGEMVSVSTQSGGERWIGMIRRMQAEPESSRRADIAVLSRKPQAVALRPIRELGEGGVMSDAASRQFAFDEVHAIILADGTAGSQPPNLLLPPEAWREGRVFEAQMGAEPRLIRGLQVVRRGNDYVRATFEWVPAPG